MSDDFVLQLAYLRDVDISRISGKRSRINYHGVQGTVASGSVYNDNVEVVILGEANRADVYVVEPTQGKFHGKDNSRGILVPRRHLYLGDGRLEDLWDGLIFAPSPNYQPGDAPQVA